MEDSTVDAARDALVQQVVDRVLQIFSEVEKSRGQIHAFRLDVIVDSISELLKAAQVFGIIPADARKMSIPLKVKFRKEVVALAVLGLKGHAALRVIEHLRELGVPEGLCTAIEVKIALSPEESGT